MSTQELRVSHCPSSAQRARAGADSNLPGDHRTSDSHSTRVAGDPSIRNGHGIAEPQAIGVVAGPSLDPANDSPVSKESSPDRVSSPQSTNLEPSPILEASAGVPTSPAANESANTNDLPPPGNPSSGDHSRIGNPHRIGVAAPSPPGSANDLSASRVNAPVLADPLLALATDVLDDLEQVRIANENRLRQLTRDEADKDGEERGFGLTLDHPDVARLAALVDALVKAEHDATLNLQRMVRKHQLGPWIKATKGIGEKQGARLIAAIGDPYWNDLHSRPRTVYELYAYCGYHVLPAGHSSTATQVIPASGGPPSARHGQHGAQTAGAGGTQHLTSQPATDTHSVGVGGGPSGSDPGQTNAVDQSCGAGVAATPKRGQRANWSATAKMRTFLIAGSCIKQAASPYRAVYDEGRAKYADAVHAVECKRCGPAGKPAQPGSPISAGHQHARALRLVSKTILRDLWREAKRIHEGEGL